MTRAAGWLLGVALITVRTASGDQSSPPSLRATFWDVHPARSEGRQLQRGVGGSQKCSLLAARILPSPSLREYDKCLNEKVSKNSSHDWSMPGAEFAALNDCWCKNNLTQTMTDYGCCSHPSFRRMCSLDCQPDCNSSLARQCIQDCPPMCLEAAEYVVERGLCDRCNADTCFPPLRCLVDHAENLTKNDLMLPTCDENQFRHDDKLKEYWKCWRNVPKHSSHWNVLSSMMHCACREGMKELANRSSCCGSVTYGGGVCETHCPSESECATQEAQSCIHNCQTLCPSEDPAASAQCRVECLGSGAKCKKYAGCRPPMLTTSHYVCDDGQMPRSDTGCCVSKVDQATKDGCPKLCETQFVWRLDRRNGVPWWARWRNRGEEIVYQCTCGGCPERTPTGVAEVKRLVEENIWENGQVMLVDIARRENLQLGPNRRMQELMLERNKAVRNIWQTYDTNDSSQVEYQVDKLNAYYTTLIEKAAREYPDDGYDMNAKKDKDDDDDDDDDGRNGRNWTVFIVVVVVCTLILVSAIGLGFYCVIKKRKETPITTFGANEHVVIGSPVQQGDAQNITKVDGYATGAVLHPAGSATVCAAPARSKTAELS